MTDFPRRERRPNECFVGVKQHFKAEPGDLLVAKLDKSLDRFISRLHGFFTHAAIVTEIDSRGRPLTVSHAYGAGLLTQSFESFKKGYVAIALARLPEARKTNLVELLKAANANTVNRNTIRDEHRAKSERLALLFSGETTPESDTLGDGYGFSGHDLGLAALLSARARLRDLALLPFDEDFEWTEELDAFVNADLRYKKSPRALQARRYKRFTCAGRVLQIYDTALGKGVVEPAFLEDIYRKGDWVFDSTSQTLYYQGPTAFSENGDPASLLDANLLQAFGRSGGVSEQPQDFDIFSEETKDKALAWVLKQMKGRGASKKFVDRRLTNLETLAVGWGSVKALKAERGRAFAVQSVVGPCDLWESPGFEKRGFLTGWGKYQKFAKESEDLIDQVADLAKYLGFVREVDSSAQ